MDNIEARRFSDQQNVEGHAFVGQTLMYSSVSLMSNYFVPTEHLRKFTMDIVESSITRLRNINAAALCNVPEVHLRVTLGA